jgi:hypothetical protein
MSAEDLRNRVHITNFEVLQSEMRGGSARLLAA